MKRNQLLTNLTKKCAAVTLAALMLTAALAGCGAQSTSSSEGSSAAQTSANSETSSKAADGKQTEIKFLHIWPEYETLFNEQIADFEKENPNIKIVTTVVPWDQLTKTLQTSFAAGNAPDVTVAWLDRMGGFKAINACLDLTSYMTANGNEWKDSLSESAVSLGTVGDQIYGVPFRSTATMLVYNKTMLEEHNWTLPTTLEEFEALNQKVKEAGITPLIAPGNPEGYQVSSLTMTFVEHELYKSGKIQTKDYLTGYMSDVADEYAKGGERARTWLNNGWIGADSLAIKREEGQAQFFAQKGLFFFANNNELLTLRESAKKSNFEIGYLGFPAPKGMPMIMYKLGVDGFFVNQNTANPDECVTFLKYLTSQAVQQKWADETLSAMSNLNVQYNDPDLANVSNILNTAKSFRIKFPYNQGLLLTDESVEIANFMSDPSITPQQLGEKIKELKQKCIDENG